MDWVGTKTICWKALEEGTDDWSCLHISVRGDIDRRDRGVSGLAGPNPGGVCSYRGWGSRVGITEVR
jgi:hypothetical protein